MNENNTRPTLEELETLEEGDWVRHCIFGECAVVCHGCQSGELYLRIESESGKDIYENWINNGYADDEINDERYYEFDEDEPLAEDGILEIIRY
jgi:hypothetical protein